MSDIGSSEGASFEDEKPVQAIEDVKFPPFPAPTDDDFEDDVLEDEKAYYKSKFPDLNAVASVRLHCTACDRHLGCSAKNESRMRPHPMLRTLICHTCHSFYNSGEFDKGEDGSELYCRWCGQGGQVYCCSDCIHVFCAKCIKRNLGVAKIKEIENTDDWKCFKCNPKCLWELRAICWALLRFCDLRNKVVFLTQDPELKEKYQRAIAMDTSECCKSKGKRKEKTDSAKKKEKEVDITKKVLPKLPPTIQVKKFASINLDDTPKKNLKRPASPKMKPGLIQKPISIAPCNLTATPMLKKIRLPSAPMVNPVRYSNDKKMNTTYTRMPNRPRQQFPIPIVNSGFNGLPHPFPINIPTMPNMPMPHFMGDNINLSLETLTQGLDMAAVAAFNNSQPDNDTVVCTPDFPLEPLCEVTEDGDDDVECITPGPAAPPKSANPPPLVPRALPDLSSDNIVQMTDNDVTVNALTGGLKFRVDPQTLSSKKMYRLPDGRIFAINPNPNMPGGYSATIVSVSDGTKTTPKSGETYAAKLSAIAPGPGPNKTLRSNSTNRKQKAKSTPRPTKPLKTKASAKEVRECDLKTPVEWYRYNLIDAVDALDYSLSRLNKLKKEATTGHLRTRTLDEIKYLHRTLEQLLTTSSKRFIEIRDNLNRELKQYIAKKTRVESADASEDDDDDDVEFLPNAGNDDPIFIDENSVDSVNVNESQEVDLTGAASSEHNDSAESKNISDPLQCNENFTENFNESTVSGNSNLLSCLLSENIKGNDRRNVESDERDGTEPNNKRDLESTDKQDDESNEKQDESNDKQDDESNDKQDDESNDKQDEESNDKQDEESNDKQDDELHEEKEDELHEEKKDEASDKQRDDSNKKRDYQKDNDLTDKVFDDKGNSSETEDSKLSDKVVDPKGGEINGENGKTNYNNEESMEVDELSSTKVKAGPDTEPTEDADMSEELIDNLLKGDVLDGIDNVSNTNSLDIPEKQ